MPGGLLPDTSLLLYQGQPLGNFHPFVIDNYLYRAAFQAFQRVCAIVFQCQARLQVLASVVIGDGQQCAFPFHFCVNDNPFARVSACAEVAWHCAKYFLSWRNDVVVIEVHVYPHLVFGILNVPPESCAVLFCLCVCGKAGNDSHKGK